MKRARRSGHGTFSGEPRTIWLTGKREPDRKMRMAGDFWFDDPAGKRWLTPEKYEVDGASIPRALWTLIGSPYTGNYRRASIVHDKACDDAVGNPAARLAADRIFYHACRAGGCSVADAIVLYVGVRIGAWKPRVQAWRETPPARVDRPRWFRTAAEARMEADFRLVVDRVLRRGLIDDPVVIQQRTEAALRAVIEG